MKMTNLYKKYINIVHENKDEWIKTNYGFKIYIPKEQKVTIQKATLRKYGFYEEKLSDYLYNSIKEDDIFVDIGACYGYFTLLARQRTKKTISFEPNINTFKTLKINCPNMDIRNYGLGNEPKKIQLYAPEDPGGSTFINSNLSRKGIKTFNMQMCDIKVFDELNLKPTIIKLDVEGYEEYVLEGMKELISKHPPRIIIVEIETVQRLIPILSLLKGYTNTLIDNRNYIFTLK